MTSSDPIEQTAAEEPVDVAAIMRQVRRQIAERRGLQADRDLADALDRLNQRWDSVYEPLHLSPSRYAIGRVWDVLRTRLHNEVRSYLDPMI